jgi:hypothetical protein
MPILQANDSMHIVPEVPAHDVVRDLDSSAGLEDELDAMVESLYEMVKVAVTPDILMASCMAYQARCTEIYLQLIRIEARVRKARQFRTQQLQKVMDLIEFTYRGASRLIEIRRQEIELTR